MFLGRITDHLARVLDLMDARWGDDELQERARLRVLQALLAVRTMHHRMTAYREGSG